MSTHSGFFLSIDTSCVGRALPAVVLEVGCEPLELELKPEGELDEVDPPTDDKPLDVFAPPEAPPRQEEESLRLRLRLSFGRRGVGTASESRNTSPRMCSTFWAGTPDWLTGWVNTKCTPVALRISSPELFVVPSEKMPPWSLELGVVVAVPV
jgi:hypothetical protein